MIKINTVFATVLLAAAGFAGVTYAAEGEYFEGAQKNALEQSRPGVSHENTGSVSPAARMYGRLFDEKAINSGDYYEGTSRPN